MSASSVPVLCPPPTAIEVSVTKYDPPRVAGSPPHPCQARFETQNWTVGVGW
jgi:hypothetical protein